MVYSKPEIRWVDNVRFLEDWSSLYILWQSRKEWICGHNHKFHGLGACPHTSAVTKLKLAWKSGLSSSLSYSPWTMQYVAPCAERETEKATSVRKLRASSFSVRAILPVKSQSLSAPSLPLVKMREKKFTVANWAFAKNTHVIEAN